MVDQKSKKVDELNTKNEYFDFESIENFDSMGICNRLSNQIQNNMNFEKPTKIQTCAIPFMIENPSRDILLKAQTGSGKTLTYLIPILHHLNNVSLKQSIKRDQGTRVLILSPTRELCLQIFSTLTTLLKAFNQIVAGLVCGGQRKKSEKQSLRKGCTILVAAPGRCLDHLQTTTAFKIDLLDFLVLDEADRLLDMGFEATVKSILNIVNIKTASKVQLENNSSQDLRPRQNILVSATLDQRISQLASFALTNPVYIDVNFQKTLVKSDVKKQIAHDKDNKNETKNILVVPQKLVQLQIQVTSRMRLSGLIALMRSILFDKRLLNSDVLRSSSQNNSTKILVFVRTCSQVEYYYEVLSRLTLSLQENNAMANEPHSETPIFADSRIYRLHGNMNQGERSSIYLDFCSTASSKSKKSSKRRDYSKILISTDVAARGLDFPNLDQIIQFDPPQDLIEYVHRVGRTARINRSGTSILFLQPSETEFVRECLQNPLNGGQKVDNYPLRRCFERFGVWASRQNDEVRTVGIFDPSLIIQNSLSKLIESDTELKEHGIEACQAYIRSYAAFSRSMKDQFHVKNLNINRVANGFGLTDVCLTHGRQKGRKIGSVEHSNRKFKRGAIHDPLEHSENNSSNTIEFASLNNKKKARKKLQTSSNKILPNTSSQSNIFMSEFAAFQL